MFGYIAINKAEMKFKDYEVYHSYYCGLCRQLKEHYGKRGQMTLSFDMTFLVLVLSGLYEPDTRCMRVRCIAHPMEKHTTRINEFTDYAASMNLMLSYYKCMDDWADERKKKSYLTARMLQAYMKDIELKYSRQTGLTAAKLTEITDLETAGETSLDIMAGLFGEIMSELFVYRRDEWEPSLRTVGFFLGKFIYLMDAYEDVEEDIKTGSYNPLKKEFARNPVEFAAHCRQILTMMMAECSRAFETLPILLHADIIRNILYSGVWCRYEMITAKRNSTQEKEHD